MNSPVSGRPLAIVIPWFGRELRGGAELQAWNLATRLSARNYSVEILTTCCRSFHHDWSANYHAPGLSQEDGFAIRRFLVEPRDRAAFDRVCGHLLGLDKQTLKPGVSPISEADERIFCEHLIRCPALLSYLASDGWRYAAFIFLPYLYGPILDGLPLVASRAFLQPCLHDEAYAYLRCVQRVVFAANKLLWLSEGEFEIGRRLFGPSVLTKSVIGMAGVESLLPVANADQQLAEVQHLKPFVLILGRKDLGKGTLLAVEAFRSHRIKTGSTLNLVIAGPGEMTLTDPEHNIHDLGLVSENMRCWLLQNMEALVQPSPNESFSRVIFEAWQLERPVIARRSCLATACAVTASEGGWLAETKEEWAEVLSMLVSLRKEDIDAVGKRGAKYSATIADWERVMDRYEDALRPLVHVTEMAVRINLVLYVLKPQRVRLLIGDREVATWDLVPGHVVETGWFETKLNRSRPVLRFDTDHLGEKYPPDPRTLGFCLSHIRVEVEGSAICDLHYSYGWNRDDKSPDAVGPRWSTGVAEITIQSVPFLAAKRTIHQVLPNLGYGDAIGNHTIWIRDRLQSMGFRSEIFARHIADEMSDQAYHLSGPESLPDDAVIIYHHSIGTEITPWICRHPGPKALVYHNITPAEFFEPYRPDFAAICRQGRQDLPALAPFFPVSVGDSRFNADELETCGFKAPAVLSLCVDPAHWAHPPDESIMKQLQDGHTNILFVGRIVPNKRHEDLIYTFKFWLEDDPEARLYLVGTAEVSSFYLECLHELAKRLRVDHAVHFVGRVNDAQLHAYYRCASMFWCFSEHEGFCVPLIEACAFGIPVVARAKCAIPETLGDAGMLITGNQSPNELARQIGFARLSFDQQKMAARVANYSPLKVSQDLQSLITRLVPSLVSPSS